MQGNNMDYVLLSDDCNECRYVTSAFSLLRLPLKNINIESLDVTTIENAIAVIACKTLEKQYRKKIFELIQSTNVSLISFDDIHAKNIQEHPHLILFLKMPFSKYELKDALSHCINKKNDIPDILNVKYPIFEKLVGPSSAVSKLKSMIKQVAYSDTTVLILGQSGTGKDVVASCIHYHSDRRDNPFVPINCGAIPSELMESELFGHEKGAFTGAMARRPGRFETADHGTLFLDEIGDMPMPMQVKLLRVIQDRKIERVGGCNSINVNVRLIAATNKNLEELIQQHHFREDLYYRLNVFPIYVPSLSERKEDIPALIDYHLEKIHGRLKHSVVFTERAKEMLCEYSWPGNIRELQNFLERMVILHPDRVVDEKCIEIPANKMKHATIASASSVTMAPMPTLPFIGESDFNILDYMAKIEKQVNDSALLKANGTLSVAATFLSMSPVVLLEKIKKYNLSVELQE
jgi:sigma-54 specific flagellar transcriptional regulator A